MNHPLINPFGPASLSLEHMKLDPILVLVAESDLLKERQEEYAQRLKKLGNKVEYAEFEGQEHCFFTINHTSQPAEAFFFFLINGIFIYQEAGKSCYQHQRMTSKYNNHNPRKHQEVHPSIPARLAPS
ncbi:hypothetical protein PTKIN_Ptkin11bG0069500 [Pterospermum kingtungense]